MIGNKYQMLTIIKTEIRSVGRRYVYCLCDCGNKKWIRFDGVKSGSVISCGCFHKRRLSESKLTHNGSNHDLYKIWSGMKDRCLNPRSKDFENYGGRGLDICNEWSSDFWKFVEDMGERPTISHTIERIDNSKGYSKKNCKWATRFEQSLNRRLPSRELPTGVYKSNNSWCVQKSVKCKSMHVGNFNNLFDACCCALGNQRRVFPSQFQY